MPALAPTDKPEPDESLWAGELVAVEAVPVHVAQEEVVDEIEEVEDVEEVEVEEHSAEFGMSALEPQSSLASLIDAVKDEAYHDIQVQ